MTGTKTKRWQRRMIVGGAVLVCLFGITALIGWYLGSAAFGDLVRRKVIAALEDATGGRVDLESLKWNLSRMELRADNVTVRGLEPATEPPLAHIDSIRITARITSLLHRSIDLTYLGLDGPQVHVIVRPDGSTNIPEPKTKTAGDPVQTLFDLAIARTDVRGGSLLLNEERLPLDFSANDVTSTLSFDTRERRYDGQLQVGKIAAQYAGYRELPMTASAEFSAWKNRAVLKSLNLQSQSSSLAIKGTVDNFKAPELHFEYAGNIDLRQGAAIVRIASIRQGIATVFGSGTYSASSYQLWGKLAVRSFNYADPSFQLNDASLTSDFRADNAGIQLKQIDVHALGGQLAGTAEIRNAPRASGQAQLKLAGLSLAEVSRVLSTRDVPLAKLRITGRMDGDVGVNWKGTPSRGTANLALSFTAPPQPGDEELALSGTVRGTYNLGTGLLDVHPLQLSTKATRLDASGRIGPRAAALSVALASSNLDEIERVLNVVGQPSLPLDLGGEASFNGTVNGSTRDPQVAGQLRATGFTYVYHLANPPAPANSTTSAAQPSVPPEPRRIHFDSLTADVFYSHTKVAVHDAVARRGDTTLKLDGSAALQNGGFTDSSAFELQASAHEGDISRFQDMIGTNYPLAGHVDLTVKASGTKAAPHAQASIAITKAAAYGRPIDSFTADAGLQNDNLSLTHAKLKAPGGSVSGSGSYNLKTRNMLIDVRSDDIQLARVPELQLERLSTSGVAFFELHAGGTPDIPAVNLNLQVSKLVLNGEHVGNLTLKTVTQGQQLMVTARSDFEHANFTLDGTVGMQPNLPGSFDLKFENLDIDPFLSAEIRGRITQHSGVAGRAHLSGPLRDPRQLTGNLTVDAFHAEVEKVPIQSDGPFEVALANQTLTIERFVMTSADTRLNVAGSMGLTQDRPLQLQADGSINLAVFQTFDPDLTASGKANLDVRVRGTSARPNMTGRVAIEHLSLSNIDLPGALSDVNGSLVFNQSRLEIEKLTGHIGGGPVEFAGYIGYANAINFNITSQGSDIRFRYAGISLTANQELRLQGTLKNATVSGDITITRFAQIPSADLAAAFANTSAPVPNAASPLNNLHLDIHVRSAPELTVQTTLAKLSGDADLRVRGTAVNPVLLGRVNIAQGDLKINGQKYFLERGDMTFANPVRIDPILDVEATTRVRDFDITIGLHGTMERLLTTYRSDPPLSSEDIVSLLAFGRTQQEYSMATSGGSGGGLGEAGGSALVGAAINQAVSNRVSRLFGVSAIRINPAAGGPDNNPNARLTVEQQVSSDVTITYITNLARSAQQVLQFEYNINRDYTINAIRDENGVVSFDLLIRKRKK
jgi:translocation and assembly module TamB